MRNDLPLRLETSLAAPIAVEGWHVVSARQVLPISDLVNKNNMNRVFALIRLGDSFTIEESTVMIDRLW